MSGSNQSWQEQGRQEHGWFGHGTSARQTALPSGGGLFGPGQGGERAAAVSYGALAALPRSARSQAGSLGSGTTQRLQTLLVRWSGASRLSKDAFAGHFFGRQADDRTALALRAAATDAAAARDHGGLQRASEQVAAAMQVVGLGNWPRFLADAQDRADDPATLAVVAASQPRPASPPKPKLAAQPAVILAADPVTSDAAPPAVAVAAEPEHGAIWQWLHGLGLAKTRHEQAVDLRRSMGAESGLVYTRDGVPLNIDQMSDDEVLALNKETRGQPHDSPLIGAAAPIMTQWGWNSTPAYKAAKDQLKQAGTHETLNGRVPTREEAVRMIEESGGKVDRIEEGHHPDGDSTHHEPHINYTTKERVKCVVRKQR